MEVLPPDADHRNSRWKCLCDCGNEHVVRVSHIKKTKSCGCLRSETAVKGFKIAAQNKANTFSDVDLVGRVFDKWVVIAKGQKHHQVWHWLCRCECGVEKEVSHHHLLKGNSTCCGKCAGKKYSLLKKMEKLTATGRVLRVSGNYRIQYLSDLRKEQFEKQDGICPVCDKALFDNPSTWAWDHDHKTNECRALLHRGCNVFIGRLENDPQLIERAQKYLGAYV